MRLPPSPGGGGVGWQTFRQGILNLFRQIMPAPFRLWHVAPADQPSAADYSGGLKYNPDSGLVGYSDGSDWNEIFGAGADEATARTNLGLGAAALQTYAEDTFTPALTFGAGSTGLTYASRSGVATRIGRLVFVQVSIVLSAKGSSTGAATITGPAIDGAGGKFVGEAVLLNVNTVAAAKAMSTVSTPLTINLYDSVAGGIAQLDDTDFNNNSEIYISLAYVA